MRKHQALFMAASLLAGLSLILLGGCAGSQQGNARWLQRGEAEALLAAHAATPEKNPDPDRMPATASDLEAQGDIMASQSSIYNAINNYRLALKEAKGPSRLRLEGKLAGLDLRLGHYDSAQKSFAGLCAKQPGNAVFWQGRGLAQMGQGDLSGAEKSLSRAVSLNPALWRAQNLLGVIHNRRGQPRQAIAAFRAALQTRPNNPALYNNLALAQAMAKDLRGSEASLRRAMALDPEHRLAANNLGLLLARQGRGDEAFQVFARSQGVAQAHNNMGVILAWQGQPRQAQEQFRLAVQALPRYYPLANRHLKQLGLHEVKPVNKLATRPMTSLAERATAKTTAPAEPKTARRAKAAREPAVKAEPKATPRPMAAPKAPGLAAKQITRPPEPRPLGAKPVAVAKPAPQAKPAPLNKQQRIARHAAEAEALAKAKAEALAKAKAEALAQAEAKAKAQSEAKAKAAAKAQTESTAKPAQTDGKAQGLWMRADGSLSYGPAPDGEKPFGVVYGSGD
ncbi:MAG: tetratricopeptide repeat protein [Desulfarculaceae bacterium]|nr:tetratricopeptide repeat protein [Desulfarculaceae bacterium]MCF8047331.1 tetratricopeptide repeat protein [Desulfarculaceae bacterium]MCF8063880.1 tetratricopeptide repeat protein [Desulfarculaceae bacterium]MCF8096558.1 tetratricopeptide repeat protein [Desulfarculaceae bacterium]MCF8122114.1 tetratricopeptide repeat protein [Desulfarculaceae bacterium]